MGVGRESAFCLLSWEQRRGRARCHGERGRGGKKVGSIDGNYQCQLSGPERRTGLGLQRVRCQLVGVSQSRREQRPPRFTALHDLFVRVFLVRPRLRGSERGRISDGTEPSVNRSMKRNLESFHAEFSDPWC